MSILKFSLSPESTGRIHDLLLCLAKFGEYVSFEARGDQQVTYTRPTSCRNAAAVLDTDDYIAHSWCPKFIQDRICIVLARSQNVLHLVQVW